MKNKIDIIVSGTWSTASFLEQYKILNQTIQEFVNEDVEVINIQRVEENGLYRFYIYTISKNE